MMTVPPPSAMSTQPPRDLLGPPPGPDVEDARLHGAVKAALFGTAADPVRIGRYVLVRRLGSGGMGVVYAAFDEELDRKVALKLLRTELGGDDGTEGRARLIREAQAMARLAHPNVVAVHDVGTHGEQVYVAMEFVQGPTLKAWLAARRRPRGEIMAVLRQAGRGLLAAHRAGIVHRDFKPDNVILGDDGRVRVLDFGLAVPTMAPPEAAATEGSGPRLRGSLALTRTGAVMGTPAYMPPEQHRGKLADARSDQFSFAVTCWEALYGRRPFSGDTAEEILAAPLVQTPRRTGPRLPRRIHRALVRALRPEPADRWPALDGLLAALRPRARSRFVAAGLVAASGLGAAGLLFMPAGERCEDATLAVAEVWSDARRAEVTAALARPDVIEALDGYAAALAEETRAACMAAVAAQIECVDRRRERLEDVVGVLDRDPGATSHWAHDALNILPPLGVCADPDARRREPAAVEGSGDRVHRAELLVEVAGMERQLRSRELDDRSAINALLERAELEPDIQAKLLLVEGLYDSSESLWPEPIPITGTMRWMRVRHADKVVFRGGLQPLMKGVTAAEVAGDDVLASRLSALLLGAVDDDGPKRFRARKELVEARIGQTGDPTAVALVALESSARALNHSKPAEAAEYVAAAQLAIARSEPPLPTIVGLAQTQNVRVLVAGGELADAEVAARRFLGEAIDDDAWGRIVEGAVRLSWVQTRQAKHDDARTSLGIAQQYARTPSYRGRVLLYQAELAARVGRYLQAVELLDRVDGALGVPVGLGGDREFTDLVHIGLWAEAHALRTEVALAQRAPTDLEVLNFTGFNAVETSQLLRLRVAVANREFEAARRQVDEIFASDRDLTEREFAELMAAQAAVFRRDGHADSAVSNLRRAVETRERPGQHWLSRFALAEARLALAHALVDTAGPTDEARALAEAALEVFMQSDGSDEPRRQAARALLERL